MSKIVIVIGSLVILSVVVVAFGGNVTGGIEEMLLSLHGDHGAAKDPDREAARSRALSEGWPDTPPGIMGSGWVEAFSAGEDAMREFNQENRTKASLAENSMEERISTYHKLHEQFGDLMFGSVVESNSEELTVVLLAEDASSNRFVFKVEEDPPHKLVMVGMIDYGHGHGGHSGAH